jgi:hypothetical protein
VARSLSDVVHPPDGGGEILGLPTVPGFLCHHHGCAYWLASQHQTRQHYNKQHNWRITQDGAMPWHKAYVQTLFNWKQAIHYFTVTLTNIANPLSPPSPVLPAPGRNAGEEHGSDNLYPHIPSTNTLTSTPAPSTTNDIITASLQRLQQLIKPPQRTQLDAVCHVSDLNPWFT